MILLFLDLQGALFHSPLELKITVKFHSKPEAFGHMSPHCRLSDLGPFRSRIFPHKWGIEPAPMAMNQIIRNQHVKCNHTLKAKPLNKTVALTLRATRLNSD
jgi:hypothetical protein